MSDTDSKRIVVMTGATSGIGARAVTHLAKSDTQVVIGARGGSPAVPTGPEGVEVITLDLASLDSVRAFADAVRQRLGDASIDIVVLNAGAQFWDANQRSIDGFEATFAINHLSHYLLARLLLPAMAAGGRLVITTSDTHDPAIFRRAPTVLDPEALAHPATGGAGGAMSAYAASKLCNLLTARSLAVLDEVRERDITVIAYNPGLTGGTSLGRAQPRLVRMMMPAMRPLFAVLSRFRSHLHMGSPERAGEALAQLAAGDVTPPPGRVYASLVRGEITFPDPSKLARDDEARDLLWRESAAVVGLLA